MTITHLKLSNTLTTEITKKIEFKRGASINWNLPYETVQATRATCLVGHDYTQVCFSHQSSSLSWRVDGRVARFPKPKYGRFLDSEAGAHDHEHCSCCCSCSISWGYCYQIFLSLRLCRFSTDRNQNFSHILSKYGVRRWPFCGETRLVWSAVAF